MNNTALFLSVLEENHRMKVGSITKAIKYVDRAINENSYMDELERAKQNLNLALMRENIDYENRKSLIESEDNQP